MSADTTLVRLVEIERENLPAVLGVKVAPEQERFVANNAVSIAQAHYADDAWFRAVYAGDEPVGFTMMAERAEEGQPYLWRFLIGAEHQGKGYGREALALTIEHARSLDGAKELFCGVVEGEGSPLGFYLGLGFEDTGRHDDDELVLRYDLAASG